eukprot:8873892-Pyramimonas_sp.AAC.1
MLIKPSAKLSWGSSPTPCVLSGPTRESHLAGCARVLVDRFSLVSAPLMRPMAEAGLVGKVKIRVRV